MAINLKEAAEHGINEGTNWTSHTLSSMHFEDARHDISEQYAPSTAEDTCKRTDMTRSRAQISLLSLNSSLSELSSRSDGIA